MKNRAKKFLLWKKEEHKKKKNEKHMIIKRRKRKHWKNEMKWQEMTWDGLMQRMTRGRCPCHCDHRTNNYQWKITKRMLNRMRRIVFRERWTSSLIVKKKKGTSKSFFWCRNLFLSLKISYKQLQNLQQRLQQRRAHAKNILLSTKTRKKGLHNFFQKKGSFFRNKQTTETTKFRESRKVFFFVLNGGKELLHHDKNIDHSNALLQISTVSERTRNLGELVVASHTAMYWICGTTTIFCTSLRSTMTNSTHQTTVLSRPLFAFGFSSCPFLHCCSSINPTLHLLFSNHHSSSFSDSIPFRNFARCIPLAPVVWQVLSFGIVGCVLRPSLVGLKLERCMAVAHVLFKLKTRTAVTICQFACFILLSQRVAFLHFF